MRMNDGKADPQGRLWCGTMGIDDPQPEGALYRLDGDWSLRTELTGLTIPNGIGWSPDAATMYFTDSTWSRIDRFAYDVDAGTLSDRRTFVDIRPELGLPDGLTVDEDGCVWVAIWFGAAVHRYTPDGELDTVVRIPALQATSCVFGGSDRRDLFITSASFRLTVQQLEDHPRAGRVFTCRPGVVGTRTAAFRLYEPIASVG
jgi:sugar lactone lactonase YvrE